MEEKKHGGKRPGAGKKLGSTNVVTTQLRFDLLATMRKHGFDPLEKVLYCYDEAKKLYERSLETNNHWLINSRLAMMQNAAGNLMEYVYPKRKSIELTGAGGEDLFKSFVDMVKEVHNEVKNSDAIEVQSERVE